MSDLSINFAKTGVVNNKKNIVAEKAETKNDNSSSSSAANVVLSGLGAVAAIAVGIMAIRKFQGAKVVKEIGIDKFKEAGNIFIKGQALTKDGQPFTGIITKIGKDGLKHNIEYTNGIIKEVKTYKPTKIFDGSVKDFPVSKKGYNYNAQGKLESIDNFSWAHVNTTDPKTHGFQYIKTSTTNLDKKRADGLKKFTEKQAEIKKYSLDFCNLSRDKSQEIYAEKRKVSIDGTFKHMLKINARHVRVGAGGCTKIGLTQEEINNCVAECREEGKNPTDRTYLKVANRKPIALIHIIQTDPEEHGISKIPEFIFALSLGFPGIKNEQCAKYVINGAILAEDLEDSNFEDEDEDLE